MKLVESDLPHEEAERTEEVAGPPRPEHRRVHVSLLLTFAVLVTTVAVVYAVFPKRDHEAMTAAIRAHRDTREYALSAPGQPLVDAWTIGLFGRKVPWPEAGGDVHIVGARALIILRRPAAMVRYEIDGVPVSVVVLRPRDALRRTHRRVDGDELAISWRRGRWTFVAVGPADRADLWRPVVGAPP